MSKRTPVSKSEMEVHVYDKSAATCCDRVAQAIECQKCKIKLHLVCVGLTQTTLKRDEPYVCRDCKKLDKHTSAKDDEALGETSTSGTEQLDFQKCMSMLMERLNEFSVGLNKKLDSNNDNLNEKLEGHTNKLNEKLDSNTVSLSEKLNEKLESHTNNLNEKLNEIENTGLSLRNKMISMEGKMESLVDNLQARVSSVVESVEEMQERFSSSLEQAKEDCEGRKKEVCDSLNSLKEQLTEIDVRIENKVEMLVTEKLRTLNIERSKDNQSVRDATSFPSVVPTLCSSAYQSVTTQSMSTTMAGRTHMTYTFGSGQPRSFNFQLPSTVPVTSFSLPSTQIPSYGERNLFVPTNYVATSEHPFSGENDDSEVELPRVEGLNLSRNRKKVRREPQANVSDNQCRPLRLTDLSQYPVFDGNILRSSAKEFLRKLTQNFELSKVCDRDRMFIIERVLTDSAGIWLRYNMKHIHCYDDFTRLFLAYFSNSRLCRAKLRILQTTRYSQSEYKTFADFAWSIIKSYLNITDTIDNEEIINLVLDLLPQSASRFLRLLKPTTVNDLMNLLYEFDFPNQTEIQSESVKVTTDDANKFKYRKYNENNPQKRRFPNPQVRNVTTSDLPNRSNGNTTAKQQYNRTEGNNKRRRQFYQNTNSNDQNKNHNTECSRPTTKVDQGTNTYRQNYYRSNRQRNGWNRSNYRYRNSACCCSHSNDPNNDEERQSNRRNEAELSGDVVHHRDGVTSFSSAEKRDDCSKFMGVASTSHNIPNYSPKGKGSS